MPDQVEAIRSFNRFYTDFLGLLKGKLYETPISLSQARILLEIGHQPGIRARDLMDRLQIDRGHLSRTLKKLEKMELASRQRDEKDRRAYGLSLTGQGKKLLAHLEKSSSGQISDILKTLEPRQRRKLVDAMDVIRDILDSPKK